MLWFALNQSRAKWKTCFSTPVQTTVLTWCAVLSWLFKIYSTHFRYLESLSIDLAVEWVRDLFAANFLNVNTSWKDSLLPGLLSAARNLHRQEWSIRTCMYVVLHTVPADCKHVMWGTWIKLVGSMQSVYSADFFLGQFHGLSLADVKVTFGSARMMPHFLHSVVRRVSW